ncbi:MAG TPA: YafY family protein [Solirubrobacteraceae bacterium]|nr:YafY family protein [Solirubrobacteraceae bacterium]
MSEVAGRLLELLSLLQGRREWRGEELARRLGVSRRTLRRDIERLRGLGYPVRSDAGIAGGYRLRAGSALPPLLLDDEEATAIALGLRIAAGSALAGIEETAVRALVKLEQVLPSHLRRRVSALDRAISTLPVGGADVQPRDLVQIAAACRDRERLRFDYIRRDGAQSTRDVEPHALVNHGRRWYLVAWDLARGDWRTFRVDRATSPKPAGARFERRALPASDAATFVARSLAGMQARLAAVLTLHAPAAEIKGRLWGASAATLEEIDETRCRLRIVDDDIRWLALRLLMLGIPFEAHEPPELIEHLRVLGARLQRATRPTPAPTGTARRRP